jgi:hypothetical protein
MAADGKLELDPVLPQADTMSAVPRRTTKLGRFLMPITDTSFALGLWLQ